MTRRRVLAVLGVVLLVVLLPCGGLVGSIAPHLPSSQGDLVDAADGRVGVRIRGSYAWILPTDNGAVLIDTGGEEGGAHLLAALAARGIQPSDVHTILLTHGHGDHLGGLSAFPAARVVAGPGEGPLIRGEDAAKGRLQQWLLPLTGLRDAPAQPIEEARDGAVLDLDGLSARVVHVPGHTGGSAMYLVGDLLFTGDSLTAHGEDFGLLPPLFADDIDQNRSSLEVLRTLPFSRIADGHGGVYDDAHRRLVALLDR